MRPAWLLVAVTACSPWRQESSRGTLAVLVDDRFRGVELSGMHQANGVGMSASASGQFLERDDTVALHRRDFGSGLDDPQRGWIAATDDALRGTNDGAWSDEAFATFNAMLVAAGAR